MCVGFDQAFLVQVLLLLHSQYDPVAQTDCVILRIPDLAPTRTTPVLSQASCKGVGTSALRAAT